MAAASTALAVGAALAVVVLQRYYMICTMPVYIHQHPNTFNNYHIISYHIMLKPLKANLQRLIEKAIPHLIAGLHNTVNLEALLAVQQNNPNMGRD